tara:strand:+ start:2490 stop:2735 length:246 start_codon:yes stop_codon:yes gene_type:complete
MKPGDLVRYIRNTKSSFAKVLPNHERPIGVIMEIQETPVGCDDEYGAIMTVILVRWADDRWNNDTGMSEECIYDLELIQEL